MRTIHNFAQGSDPWHQHRARAFNASEASMLMGVSKYGSRSDLLRQKATGVTPEVTAIKQALFDQGHAVETPTIALIEEAIGEALAPVVASLEIDGLLLGASYDGLAMFEDTGAEVKLWNEALAQQIRRGEIEPHYYWQLEQHFIVTPTLERLIFATSDGTREKFVYLEYRPVPGRREALIAAWRQFNEDLAAYVPTEAAPVVTAQPVASLPAVSVRVDGALAVISNLPSWGVALREFIANIPTKPTSEQEFANAEAAVKALKKAEEALDAAEAGALGQIASVEEMTRMVADLRTLAKTTRLATNTMVTARKLQIRTEEVQRGKDAFAAHIAGLNQRLGKPYMPGIVTDFPGVISGKKNIDSLRNAIDSELARGKIAANEWADRLDLNLQFLREHAKDHAFLFADTGLIILKPADDLQTLVKSRISDHQAAEQKKADDLREKIRAEEQAKAEKDARDKLAAEQAERDLQARRDAEAEAERQRQAAAPTPMAEPLTSTARMAIQVGAKLAGTIPADAPMLADRQGNPVAANVVPMGTRAPAVDTGATIRLGQINDLQLHCRVTAEDLAALGFQPVGKDRAAVLYRQCDVEAILAALIKHLMNVGAGLAQQRAA